jgi:hypothetical protein
VNERLTALSLANRARIGYIDSAFQCRIITMRLALLALPSLLAAAPALAQAPAPHAPGRPDPATVVRALQNPAAQDLAAAYLDQLADIVLDTRVGPAAALADPRVPPSATLRQLQERRDPAFEQHLREQTRRAVGTAATVAGGTAVEAAELKRTADRLQAAVAPLVAMLNGAR